MFTKNALSRHFFLLTLFAAFFLGSAVLLPAQNRPLQSQNIRRLPISAKDLVYDKTRGKIYASVAANDVSYGNNVVTINPVNGNIENAIFVGSQPNKLALTDDGKYLYVTLNGAAAIRRINLQTGAAELQFPVGTSQSGILYAYEIATIPGSPNSVVASRHVSCCSGYKGVAIYDDGVQRPGVTPDYPSSNEITIGDDPSIIFGLDSGSSLSTFSKMQISNNGISFIQNTPDFVRGRNIKYSDGKIYSTSGQVVDAATSQLLGTFSLDYYAAWELAPDETTNRTYFAYDYDNNGIKIAAYDSTLFQLKGYFYVPAVYNDPVSFIRWGYNGLAFCTTQGETFLIQTPLVPSQAVSADFDGDRKSDLAVFRPSDSNWYWHSSQNGNVNINRFGLSDDQPLDADFDGDGKNDLAVYRGGVWYWLGSANGTFNAAQFGLADDLPVPSDFDGDGFFDIAVWRPSTGVWYVLRSGGQAFSAVQFGLSQDKAVPADYDGDGKTDFAVFRPDDGNWYVLNSVTNRVSILHYGSSGDVPIPADYDGDIKTDFAVYRSSESAIYILHSRNSQTEIKYVPANVSMTPGDYDGDGKADVAFVQNGLWTIYQSSTGGFTQVGFGLEQDKYVASR